MIFRTKRSVDMILNKITNEKEKVKKKKKKPVKVKGEGWEWEMERGMFHQI